ncbi:hypothetical protein B1L11_37375 [Microbispora sp. GKU 823]|nr:hypothetical protein B1L11_37375 [Microbispora sp. GKU 823]
MLLTSEIATNAVVHSRSGDGGTFTVTVSCLPDRVRVCVEDDGSAGPPCAGSPAPQRVEPGRSRAAAAGPPGRPVGAGPRGRPQRGVVRGLVRRRPALRRARPPPAGRVGATGRRDARRDLHLTRPFDFPGAAAVPGAPGGEPWRPNRGRDTASAPVSVVLHPGRVIF